MEMAKLFKRYNVFSLGFLCPQGSRKELWAVEGDVEV